MRDTNTKGVATTVRAEIARRRVRQRVIAEHLGLTQAGVSRRVVGDVPWTADELQQLAELLGMPVTSLYGEQVSA